jgi:hypothetical protein
MNRWFRSLASLALGVLLVFALSTAPLGCAQNNGGAKHAKCGSDSKKVASKCKCEGKCKCKDAAKCKCKDASKCKCKGKCAGKCKGECKCKKPCGKATAKKCPPDCKKPCCQKASKKCPPGCQKPCCKKT